MAMIVWMVAPPSARSSPTVGRNLCDGVFAGVHERGSLTGHFQAVLDPGVMPDLRKQLHLRPYSWPPAACPYRREPFLPSNYREISSQTRLLSQRDHRFSSRTFPSRCTGTPPSCPASARRDQLSHG